MAEFTAVSVELDAHLLKFMRYHYGDTQAKAGRDDLMGAFFIALLEKPPYNWRPQKIEDSRKWTYLIERHNSEGRGWWVSRDNQLLFQKHVKGIFDLVFNSYMTVSVVSDGAKVTAAINNFRAKYDIHDEDITLDAMKKAFFRLRKEVNQQNISEIKKIPASCPFFNGLVDKYLSKNGRYNKAC